MPTADDVATSIISNLAFTEPDLDTSIGSVARKIIDAVAGSTAEAFVDQQLTRYQYDIDSMTAGSLEGFVRLFGMDRQQARLAIGTVTFTRSTALASTTVASIPLGTQVLAMTDPPRYAQTITSVTMALGQTTIDVPVQATVPGSVGNIAAGLLTTLVTNVEGVSPTCINTAALTGGQDAENDNDLRARWKQTVFRNLAGTEQMYRAMALQADPSVSAVNILGPRKSWLDRITITGGTSGALSFGNPAFIYTSSVVIGNNIPAQDLLTRNANYTVVINNSASPATITVNSVAGGMPDGDYDIQFDYVPVYSRNDPFGTRFGQSGAYVSNRIDLWTNGSDVQQVTQNCLFSTASGQRFVSTPTTGAMYTGRFRKLNNAAPSANDIFQPLAYGPIVFVPSTIVIGGSTYSLGTHYDIVHQSDAFGYSPTSLFGLVWYAAGSIPANNATFSLTYQYNAVPSKIARSIESQWRLLGTDVSVHAGIATLYRFHLAVMYERNADPATVNTDIQTALSILVSRLGFDSSLQVSDVLQSVHNISGVDNVRFLTSNDDGTHYAIEPILPSGTPTTPISQVGGRAADLYFDDANFPLFHSVRIVTKTRSNFGTS